MTPEGGVKAKVKRALMSLVSECYYFMPVQNGMGAPALDFYGCYRGHFFAIETKAPGKILTMRQYDTKGKIEDADGVVFIVRNDADISNMVQTLNSWQR